MNRDRFRNIIAEEIGEAFAYSYVDLSEFTDGTNPVLRPWSHVANERLRDMAWKILQREGVKLGPVVAKHLQPKHRQS